MVTNDGAVVRSITFYLTRSLTQKDKENEKI